MKSPRTSWFWIVAAFIAGAVVCLVPGRAEAGWTDEYSYQDFFEYYTKTGAHASDGVVRTEVVYVGANDGMFHCFKVETGEELWAFIPPSLLTKLKHMVPDATGSLNHHQYFIDGKAIVKDIKVGTSNDWTDWKTVEEHYEAIPGFAKQVAKTPASMDLSGLPKGYRFQFELRLTDTTDNPSKPILDGITLTIK